MDTAEGGEEQLADGTEGNETEQLRELKYRDLAIRQGGDAGVFFRADEEVTFERAGKVGSGNGLPRSEGVKAALTSYIKRDRQDHDFGAGAAGLGVARVHDGGEELVAGGHPEERLGDGGHRVLALRLMCAKAEEAGRVGKDIEADARQLVAIIGEHRKELVGGVGLGRLPATGRNPDGRGRLTGDRNHLRGETQGVGFGFDFLPLFRGLVRGVKKEGALNAGAINRTDERDGVGRSSRLGGELGEDGFQLTGCLILDRDCQSRFVVSRIKGHDLGLGDIGRFLLQLDLGDRTPTAAERHLDALVLDEEALGVGAGDGLGGLRRRSERSIGYGVKRGRSDWRSLHLGSRGRRGARRRSGRLGEEEKGEGADDAGHTQEEVLAIHGK